MMDMPSIVRWMLPFRRCANIGMSRSRTLGFREHDRVQLEWGRQPSESAPGC